MHEEIFSDGVGDIAVTGSVVRLDLMSISPHERDNRNHPRLVFRQRVVMPLEGFVRTFGAMEQVMAKLVQAGLIEKNAASQAKAAVSGGPVGDEEGARPGGERRGEGAPTTASGGSATDPAASVRPRSPNFG